MKADLGFESRQQGFLAGGTWWADVALQTPEMCTLRVECVQHNHIGVVTQTNLAKPESLRIKSEDQKGERSSQTE